MKIIKVVAASSLESLENDGADVEDCNIETIKAAKDRAKYLLTEEFRIASESSQRLGYARVLVNGECVADYFGN